MTEKQQQQSQLQRLKVPQWCPGAGEGDQELCFNGEEFQFCKMITFLRRMVVMTAQHYECTYCHWSVHSKTVKMPNFLSCAFYHHKKQLKGKKSSGLKWLMLPEAPPSRRALLCSLSKSDSWTKQLIRCPGKALIISLWYWLFHLNTAVLLSLIITVSW